MLKRHFQLGFCIWEGRTQLHFDTKERGQLNSHSAFYKGRGTRDIF